MSGPKASIRLLLIHDSQQDAEPLLNQLRQADYSARSHFIASEAELEQVLNAQQWDLVYLKLDTETVDPWECLIRLQRCNKDLPIIGLIDHDDAALFKRALTGQITDIILNHNYPHLLHASIREFNNLQYRREKRNIDILLKESEKRCQLLLDNARDAIAYVHDGMHIYANQSYLQLFGYDDLDELACMPIMDLVEKQHHDTLKEALKTPLQSNIPLELTGLHENGDAFAIKMQFSAASYEGENCLQLIIRTPTNNNSELEDKIKLLSSQDLVTGLFNRSRFNDELDALYQHCIQNSHSRELLYLSINKFSELKGSVGIAGTDLILKDVADILTQHLPENTKAARYRDDVFTVLFPSQPLSEVKAQAENICQDINKHLFEVDGKTLHLTASIGISSIDERLKHASESLAHAHQANSSADEKNPVCYFDRSDASNLNDDSLLAQIEHAIEHNHFNLYFQPIVNLHGSGQEHYEVSIYLQDDDKGEVSRDTFMSAAIDSGLATKLDRWLVGHAVERLAQHRSQGHSTILIIPISFESLQDATFLPWVNSMLKQGHLPGDAIALQISEESAHTYLKAAKAFSKGLSLIKSHLAIRNFGKLDLHLSICKHLDISYISLHQEFAEQLNQSDEAIQQLTDTVNAIHEYDICSIIPNIDSPAVLTTLWQAGVTYIQGEYLQNPGLELNYNFNAEEDM